MEINRLVHLAVSLLILHFIEELMTKFYLIDPLTFWIANKISLDSFTTYLIGQVILFIFVAVILIGVYKKRTLLLLILSLGILCLLEAIHIYEAIKNLRYYSGVITSLPLVIIGGFIIKTLRKQRVS